MDSGVSMSFLLQFAYRIPIWFVYIVGFILAIAFWKRSPRACLLAFFATGLECLTIPLFAFLQFYILQKGAYGMSGMSMVSLAGTFSHLVSTVLLIIAVFIGRPRPSLPQPPLESVQNQ